MNLKKIIGVYVLASIVFVLVLKLGIKPLIAMYFLVFVAFGSMLYFGMKLWMKREEEKVEKGNDDEEIQVSIKEIFWKNYKEIEEKFTPEQKKADGKKSSWWKIWEW